ncbi:MAG: RNA polymerase sigma factor, partial [Gemmatimonadaceae bacterium]|nr:RNA polymerase sigma factor [Gemmatimonadaceae bacterium]
QDAWVRVVRAFPRYHAGHPFESWFFTILANRCRSAMRRRMLERRWFSPMDDDVHDVPLDPTARLDAAALASVVKGFLQSLPTEQREAFLLRHVEQLPYEEIARITGAGVSACKMRVKRATDTVRARLAEVTR